MNPKLASQVVEALKNAGIDFMTFLPESRLSPILPLIEEDESFTLIRASHEGTAVSIASGAALVGKKPCVYMEQTGVILSLYNLASVPIRAGLPVVLLASYVGSPADQGNNITWTGYGARIEGLLQAMGIVYQVLEDDYRLSTRIDDMVRAAHAAKQPTCILFTGEFTAYIRDGA